MLALPDGNGKYIKTEQAKELICRYDEVLVDEFQDVNDLQNALFELLSDDGKKLFVVGDMKQCIYAFRGSNPDIFLKKKNESSDYSSGEKGANKGARILLSENFRSRKGICETVNFFFENLMIKEVGSLVYDNGEMLNPGATFADNGEIETDFLVIDKVDEADEDSVVESEGKAIARYIAETVKKGNILSDKKGGLRPANYGDFCILLAAVKNKANVIAKELNACGIPAKVGGGEFFKSTEIIIARSLLKVISNPYSDIELLSVMMSPVYGFSAEEVARLRVGNRDKNLYSSLCACAGGKKSEKLLADLSDFRRMSCMLTVDRLVSYVLDKTDMINVFYSLPGGDIRAENLIEFMRLASEFAGNSASGLYGFLKHLDSMEDTSFKIEPKADGDCVKIMTIHGSKGLQFPICIVAGLSNTIKNPENRGYACNYSNEMGIGFKYYSRDDLKPREDFGYRLMEDRKNKGIAQERLRLLYVAFTRAEEKLCLVSCLKDARVALDTAAEATDCGARALSGRYILSANSCTKYLLAMALTHPDADVLRKVLGREVKTSKTGSRINFEFISTLSAATGEAVKNEQAPDSELANKIRSNIDCEYRFKGLTGIPAKISVSALANKAEAERFAMEDRPAFMEKDGLSAAGRGTAIHRIMQFIRFDTSPDIKSEIERLVREGRISESEAAAADTGKLKAFFESDLYRRICASADVRREMRFLTELPASYYGGEFEDKFIVQGAVDLCFTEPDGVVVVDFKTDRVDDAAALKECYSEQISVYGKACEKIFKMPVKEKIIYSFNLSQAIKV
ncbi:MAG: UvrD-helicase domain-containing protein, partial [Clostridia bacterium]|nr:UvrD-helicase domain-containing protein [Clostridia bacterium]